MHNACPTLGCALALAWLAPLVCSAACDRKSSDSAGAGEPSQLAPVRPGPPAPAPTPDALRGGADPSAPSGADAAPSTAEIAVAVPIFSTRERKMQRRFESQDIQPRGALRTLDASTLLVAGETTLRTVSASDGRVLSSAPLPGRFVDGPRRFGDAWWVVTDQGRIAGFSVKTPTTGARTALWLEGDVKRLLGFTPTAVVTLNTSPEGQPELAAYAIERGATRATEPLWHRSPQVARGWAQDVVLQGARLLLTDSKRVVALEANSGVVRWLWRTSTRPSGGTLREDGHYELFDGNRFVRLAVDNGEPAPALTLAEPAAAASAADGRRRYYGTKTQTVAVDLDSGETLWRADVPSSTPPLVGDERIWTRSGDTLTAIDKEAGTISCTWPGFKGTQTTLAGDTLVGVDAARGRLVAISCDPLERTVPEGGACEHLQRCCGELIRRDLAVGKACATVIARILDMGIARECRRALATYAKDTTAPALCRKEPPPLSAPAYRRPKKP